MGAKDGKGTWFQEEKRRPWGLKVAKDRPPVWAAPTLETGLYFPPPLGSSAALKCLLVTDPPTAAGGIFPGTESPSRPKHPMRLASGLAFPALCISLCLALSLLHHSLCLLSQCIHLSLSLSLPPSFLWRSQNLKHRLTPSSQAHVPKEPIGARLRRTRSVLLNQATA